VRILWAQVPTVHLLDGILVRKPFEGPGVQLVIPHAIRKWLFEMVHAGPLSAHLGAQRVLLQMKPVYYWPGMKKDIQIWYKQCDTCARSSGPNTTSGPTTKSVDRSAAGHSSCRHTIWTAHYS